MSFEKIKKQLKETHKLGPDIFTPDGEIVELIRSVLGVSALKVDNPKISDETETKLVIKGEISVFEVKGITASIEIDKTEGDDPAFKMTFTMEDWNPIEGLPLLSGWVAGSPLEELTIKAATLTLSNTDSETNGEEGDEIEGGNTPEADDEPEKIVAGLNLKATVDLSGRFEDAVSLADGEGTSLTLKGWIKPVKVIAEDEKNAESEETDSSEESAADAIDLAEGSDDESVTDGYYPLFDFNISLNDDANLNYHPFKLTSVGIGLRNEILLIEEDGNDGDEEAEQVQMGFIATIFGKMEFGQNSNTNQDDETKSIIATAIIPSEPEQPLEFTFAFEGANLPGFGDVVGLLGDDDSKALLPEELGDIGRFQIKSFGLNVLPEEKRPTLVMVSMEMDNTREWVLLEGVLTVEKIHAEWLVIDPTRLRTRQAYGYLFGSIEIEDDEGKSAHLQASAEYPGGDVAAWLVEGETIEIPTLLKKLVSDSSVPPGMGPSVPDKDKLKISALNLKANPKDETFFFSGEMNNIWEIETGLGTFSIESLMLSVDIVRKEHIAQFGGSFILANAEFDLLVEHLASGWVFSAELALGSEIDLSNLIEKAFKYSLGETIDLGEISITELGMQFGAVATKDKDAQGDDGNKADEDTALFYKFHGASEWNMTLPGLGKEINLQAELDISKGIDADGSIKDKPLTGEVSGSIGTAIEGFEYLELTLAYEFGEDNNALSAELALGNFITLRATLEKSNEKTTITFETIASDDPNAKTIVLTLGDMLTFIARLIDPAIEEFALDQPWDALNAIEIYRGNPGKTLSGIMVKIEFASNEKTITVSYDINKFIIPEVLEVISIGMVYQLPKDKNSSGFNISLAWKYLGDEKDETWDALNDSAPIVPSKSAFELDYLGLGQHVALSNANQFNTVEGVVGALSAAVIEGDGGSLLHFNRDSDWLIGAKFSLVDLLEMSIIFNDPVLYGMVIHLGDKAKPFNGLKFEILYRRISDTIGVYHTELTLPDDLRQFNIGAVAVTLPVVVVDIYTNGDFAVDVGFPWNGDWSRSALAEASMFTGSGGFYFAKLSGATATGLPKFDLDHGKFGLVLKFGLGLRLGLGKSFQRGPLKAELSLTMQGIFEGILAWYHYNPDPNVKRFLTERGVVIKNDPELYYHMQATVQLVGRLYGAVDFEVIKVEVEVIVYAGIQLTIDTYEPIQVVLVAGVSVRATVTILFIEVDFSFDLTIRETFTIGDGSKVPWENLPSPPDSQAFHVLESRMPFITTQSPQLRWDKSYGVWKNEDGEVIRQELDILFQPAFTEGLFSDRFTGPNNELSNHPTDPNEEPSSPLTDAGEETLGDKEEKSEVKGIALLFIENAINREEGKDFNLLSRAMLEWAIHAYKKFKPSTDKKVSKSDLDALHKELIDNQNTAFEFNDLMKFLETNFIFRLREEASTSSVHATIFPMFPQLSLWDSKNKNAPLADFADKENMEAAGDLKALIDYFDELKVGNTASNTASSDSQPVSMATAIFLDYFAMLTRSAIQSAIDYIDENPPSEESVPEELNSEEPTSEKTTSISLDDLFNGMIAAKKFDNLAGIVSRFMLYGLRLPFSLPLDADTKTYPLYELTGQQFNIPDDAVLDEFRLILKPTDADSSPPTWLKFSGDQTHLEIGLHESQKGFIEGLEALTFSPTLQKQSPLELYSWSPLRFDFRHPQPYLEGSTSKTIWSFPANLVNRLIRLDSTKSLKFEVYDGNTSKIGATDDQDALSPTWGTLIEFTVRRVPSADGTNFLENIYLVTGIGGRDANSSGEDYLEELIAKSATGMEISLLYEDAQNDNSENGDAKNKILKQAGDNFFLLRTNLAGGTGSSTLFGATQNDVADFFRLLWKAGKTEGGTYLYLEGLPDTFLASGDSLVLRLLSVEKDITALERRHNCMLTGSEIVPDKVALYGEATSEDEQVKVLNLPPGHFGFHITREPVRPKPDNWEDELDNLFQLLSYRLRSTDSFTESRWGMPVGPTVDPVKPDDPTDDVWIYERVIPAYRFANGRSQDADDGLPLVSQNPYAGISENAAIRVEFEFQDIYGNRTTSVVHPETQPEDDLESVEPGADSAPVKEVLPPMTIPVGYTDSIIELKSWPGAIMIYTLETREDVPHLALALSLDPGPDMADKAENARAVYRQLYYQMYQEDVSFTLTTSINPTLKQELDKSQITGFIEDAYRYFDALYRKADSEALFPAAVVFEGIPLSRSTDALHSDLIFPVTVQIEIKRDENLVHADFKDVEAVGSVRTLIPPLVTRKSDDEAFALRSFAEAFENAFPNLKLMSGNVDDSFGQPATLWAARFGSDGIDYTIDVGSKALFFAPTPLSNKLITGEVNSKTYTDIDLDIWGREFLAAVDAFLDADLSIPAYQLNTGTESNPSNPVEEILSNKQRLADAIASRVRPILIDDPAEGDDPETRRKEAAEILKQQLLTRLENAYTIETIAQLGVDVTLPGDWKWPGKAPRLSGKPLAVDLSAQPDYTLSTSAISLNPGRSTLTFIYNTPVPEADRLAHVKLSYHANALEFGIKPVNALPDYEDSSWLTFILPMEKTEVDGEVEIPIPLRVFPMPPSLVMQGAEADQDSLTSLKQIREWKYNFIYEHLDAAQDTIEVNIHFAEDQAGSTVADQGSEPQDALFVALANFHDKYPDIQAKLNLLKNESSSEEDKKNVVTDFVTLVGPVTDAWEKVKVLESGEAVVGSYEIQTDDLNGEKPTVTMRLNSVEDPTKPQVNIPGCDLVSSGMENSWVTYSYKRKPDDEARLEPRYGVPTIPDFNVSIDNRDIIKQQIAWAEIWLSRNRNFGGNTTTHPAFVYRTPKVRFGNMITPLLVNDKEWYIEELSDPKKQPLEHHIEQLFATILPDKVSKGYDLRISCGYAFALAEGIGDRPDLLVPLPVTLGPRFSVPADSDMLTTTEPFRKNLKEAIRNWWDVNDPSTTKGMFIFKLSILSSVGALPLLQINDLRLGFENIDDL